MSLWSVGVTPVRFLSRQKAEPAIIVPAPDVGRRWGKPSAFEYSAAESKPRQPNLIIGGAGDQSFTITGYETGREYATVRVENPNNSDEHFETEAIKAVTFHVGSRTTERMQTVSSGDGWRVIQPIYETVEEYVRFAFPVSEGTGAGLRGAEDPAETPDAEGVAPIRPGVP